MAVVIGSASIKITALSDDLKRDIGRALNDALGDLKIDANPLRNLNEELRTSSQEADRARDSLGRLARGSDDADRETRKLSATMQGLHGITRGLGATFGFLLPSMNQVSASGRILSTTLTGLTQVTAMALAGQAAFAGAGGLVAVAGALSQAAGAALLLPAAFGAGAIAIGALSVGLQGMGDALKVVGDTAKFNEAIKDLAPNARAVAVAVHEMVPAFKELRLQVQDRLFVGLGKDIAALGTVYIPVVQRGLVAMAASLNEAAQGFVAFARDRQTVADLGTLFANSALGAHFLAGAVQPILSVLRDIGVVGSEVLPGLAAGFAGTAARFAEFISQARESGQLKAILETGLTALGDIFVILGNIGSIIGSVLNAGQAAGVGFLSTAREITGELAAWAKSGAGQAAFTEFLTAAKQVATALLPILGSVIELIAHQLAPILGMIATTVGPSVKIVLDAIGNALEIARPGIEALAQGFADFLAALAPALPAIGALARALGESLGAVLSAIGPVIAEVAAVFADQLAIALPALVPAVIAIAQAFGDVLIALAPLIPALVSLLGPFVEAGGIIDALVPIIEGLVAMFVDLMEALAPLVPMIADVLVQALEALAPMIPEIAEALLALVPAFISLVEAVLPLVEPLVKLIAEILPQLIQGFTDIAVPILELVTVILNILVPALVFLIETATVVSSGVTGLFSGLGTNVTTILVDLGAFVVRIWNDIKKWIIDTVAGIVSGARDRLAAVGRIFADAFNAARDAVVNALVSMGRGVADGVGTVVAWLRDLPGKILGAVGDLGRVLFEAGKKIIRGLLDGMNFMRPQVASTLTDFTAWIARNKGPLERDRRLLQPAGKAIMAGLMEGLETGFEPIQGLVGDAAQRIAAAFAAPTLTVGVPTSGLPAPRLGSLPVTAGGDGAASPTDLHDAVIAAISGWQVTVSGREVANTVNRINKDNATR